MKSGQEALMSRPLFLRLTPAVQARVLRLNDSFEIGHRIRGLFRKPVSWRKTKRWLERSAVCPPWPCFRVPGGSTYDQTMNGPCDVAFARRKGWLV